MYSLSDFLIIWISVSVPVWAAALYLGKQLNEISKRIDRRNQVTSCKKQGCNKKTKGLLRGND